MDKVGASSYLRLSGTTKTGVTWSLAPVASCPVIDETCAGCYAMDGFYRTIPSAQVGRVKRLEYIKDLIQSRDLDLWIDWIAKKINRLKPLEDVPEGIATSRFRKLMESSGFCGNTRYFRWHDSGDLFNVEYARAVFEVARRTPHTLHWVPTRMGPLVAQIVRSGDLIPHNMTIQVSCHKEGKFEESQMEAIKRVKAIQLDARIGITYTHEGAMSRTVSKSLLSRQSLSEAHICPATIAKKKEERTCIGCRRCWGYTSTERPVVYVVHRGN